MPAKNIEIEKLVVDLSIEPDADMKRVMACTTELVELALQAKWLEVLEGIDTRRCLMQSILEREPESLNPQAAVLNEAVCESERALMRVVAHAIASSRNSGSLFALYH